MMADSTRSSDHAGPLRRSAGMDQPFDPGDMLGAVAGLPDQLEGGWERYRDLELPSGLHRPRAVVLVGMGGSAIAGDLVAHLWSGALRAPMVVRRSYSLPNWVDGDTLVVASSFSGNTEETLAAFSTAASRGARLAVITSGGELASRATELGATLVKLPPGGQPRAALGASLAAVLAIVRSAGLVPNPEEAIRGAAEAMRGLVAEAGPDTDGGDPSGLAAELEGRLPLIYVPDDLAPVGRRWKTQLNENAEVVAVWEPLPELCHNTVVGFGKPEQMRDSAHVVFLTGPGTEERLARRIDVTARMLEGAGLSHATVRAPKLLRQAEALWLVQFGDLTSVYLAYRHGVDPTAVEAIDRLKAQLAGYN